MNGSFNRNMDKSIDGFTIIETLISISITAVIILLIQMLLPRLDRSIQIKTTTSDINSYLRVLESDHYQFKMVSSLDDRLNLYSPIEHKKYRLFEKNHVVQLTSEQGGYIPLLDQVQSIHWDYYKHILKTEIIMNDGKRYITKSLISKENN